MTPTIDHPAARRWTAAWERARADLLQARDDRGPWTGELSTSALSTATAVSALSAVARAGGPAHERLVAGGVDWLAAHQNEDGGWGDTDRSFSNIATTMLVDAAWHLAGVADRHAPALGRARAYVSAQGGVAGLRRRYGKDKTFAVPILTNCALAGLADWRDVAPLPFELACLPQSWYRFAQLPVVSYAVPALVAIGQARHHHRPSWNPLVRWIRRAACAPSLDVLERMQPASGGYLEAAPLTSFVVMSLASIGRVDHGVVRNGLRFLVDSVRPDGSWPIDTNLANWNTSLAVNALDASGADVVEAIESSATTGAAARLLDWMLGCQCVERHPFTGADPGGWGWTDLSGSVPDADDTPGALLALRAWSRSKGCSTTQRERIATAVRGGLGWLLDLQNRDGGWPTFCQGWGKLPFDRSGADLTGHVLRALGAWADEAERIGLADRVRRAARRGFAYLGRVQRSDGSFIPLWFGDQHHPAEENPIYGTAKVALAYVECGRAADPVARRALDWLRTVQRPDGSWGCVEQTALAVETLAAAERAARGARGGGAAAETGLAGVSPELSRALDWLSASVETSRHLESSPIGFYFARLWYYEKLYPLTFTVAALGRAQRLLATEEPTPPARMHLR